MNIQDILDQINKKAIDNGINENNDNSVNTDKLASDFEHNADAGIYELLTDKGINY